MTSQSRFNAPVIGLLVVVLLAACGTQAPPSTSSSTSAPPAPSNDAGARDAYGTAICPVFTALIALDPRLAALRTAGAEGGDVTGQATEIAGVSDELLAQLNALEAVPEWSSGADLRYHLITALHAIRARLLRIGDDAAASSAAEELASLPFIASEAMDLAMQDATEGGLTCEGAS